MIQIQDDFVNQNQSTPLAQATDNSNPPVAVSNSTSDQNQQISQAVHDTMQKVEANTKDNTAEIDRLLAELDALSKNLESQPASDNQAKLDDKVKSEVPVTTPSTEPPITQAPAAVEPQSAKPLAISSPPAEPLLSEPSAPKLPPIEPTPAKQPVAEPFAPEPPTEVGNPLTKEEEKFDFDAFLSDLEKKIDEESAKIKAAKAADSRGDATIIADSTPTNSSTSTSASDPTLTPNSTHTPTSPLDEEEDSFRRNRIPSQDLTDEQDLIDDQNLVKDQEAATEAVLAPEPAAESSLENGTESEDLSTQNIFEMLGFTESSDEEKNQFLNELESMIWDDFVIHDLGLLLTSEEHAKAREILDSSEDEDQKKENLIIYLDKIIPDLDEVLYKKALELKSEMMGERLSKMKEGADEATLAKIKQVEDLISRNLWRQATSLLNS